MDQIREACAWVAERSEHVRLRRDSVPRYAASLPREGAGAGPWRELLDPHERAVQAAFWLTMDAINFGSGWFPTLDKDPGRSGYQTIQRRLLERFEHTGPWTAGELAAITARELANTLGQDPDHELMLLFAGSLRDLGRHIEESWHGSFLGLADSPGASAVWVAETLAGWQSFADSARYRGREIPFLKRAQIAAADLHRSGVARFKDISRLTTFADNLVPHVLRLDGILVCDEELLERISRGDPLVHGSAEEVEIRACAVHAVELILNARPELGSAAYVDQILWNRGQEPRYKAVPRHRCRCTAY